MVCERNLSESQLIGDIGRLLHEGEPYQVIILFLLICLSVEKLLKKLRKVNDVCKMKSDPDNGNHNLS